ncbi:unnamed protein product [Arctogadus glacialis]
MIKLCLQRAARPAGALWTPLTPALVLGLTPGRPQVAPRHMPVRLMGTHGRKEPWETLRSAEAAKDFIHRLLPGERTRLLQALQSFESLAIDQANQEAPQLTGAEIRYVLLHNAIPFVGFGFLDNAIMIAAGTQIELSIGVTLGISTMAAAALGNLVSDLAGLGLAGYVEALALRLGMQVPDLTAEQLDLWQTRLSSHMGKAIGITIGCILGMFPLFFLGDDDEKKKAKETPQP